MSSLILQDDDVFAERKRVASLVQVSKSDALVIKNIVKVIISNEKKNFVQIAFYSLTVYDVLICFCRNTQILEPLSVPVGLAVKAKAASWQ